MLGTVNPAGDTGLPAPRTTGACGSRSSRPRGKSVDISEACALMGDRMDRKRWPTTSPRVILIITLGAAAAVFIGGLFLARRDEHVRLTADRKPVQAIGEALEGASGRLLRLYEKHLRRLASVTEDAGRRSAASLPAMRCDCGRGPSGPLVHGKDDPTRDVHQLVDIASATRWPRARLPDQAGRRTRQRPAAFGGRGAQNRGA